CVCVTASGASESGLGNGSPHVSRAESQPSPSFSTTVCVCGCVVGGVCAGVSLSVSFCVFLPLCCFKEVQSAGMSEGEGEGEGERNLMHVCMSDFGISHGEVPERQASDCLWSAMKRIKPKGGKVRPVCVCVCVCGVIKASV